MFHKPREVFSPSGDGIDEEVLLTLDIVKKERLVEIKINLPRIQDAKDNHLVTCSGKTTKLPILFIFFITLIYLLLKEVTF